MNDHAEAEGHVLLPGKRPDGTLMLSVLVLRTYHVLPSGQCEPAGQKASLQEEPLYYEGISYSGAYRPSLLKRDMDLFPWRLNTDVVVQGTARTLQPQASLTVRLYCRSDRVQFQRAIRVTGDRFVERGRSGLRLTNPEPFTEMPMRYDKAYGGTDEAAEAKYADPDELALLKKMVGEEEYLELSGYSYPRNPAGKGYLVDPEGAEGLAWPNLEWPEHPLTLDALTAEQEAWGGRVYPACFDWFAHGWFPRIAFFDEPLPTANDSMPEREVQLGILPRDHLERSPEERPSHGFAQGAHPFLWRHRLRGDEQLRITHMSEDGRDFFIALPPARPKVVIRPITGAVETVKPVLDLVFIETDARRLTLLWRASLSAGARRWKLDWQERCAYRVYA